MLYALPLPPCSVCGDDEYGDSGCNAGLVEAFERGLRRAKVNQCRQFQEIDLNALNFTALRLHQLRQRQQVIGGPPAHLGDELVPHAARHIRRVQPGHDLRSVPCKRRVRARTRLAGVLALSDVSTTVVVVVVLAVLVLPYLDADEERHSMRGGRPISEGGRGDCGCGRGAGVAGAWRGSDPSMPRRDDRLLAARSACSRSSSLRDFSASIVRFRWICVQAMRYSSSDGGWRASSWSLYCVSCSTSTGSEPFTHVYTMSIGSGRHILTAVSTATRTSNLFMI